MGQCVSSPSGSSKATRAALVDQVMRIKLTSEQKQHKLERELKTQEDLLLQAVGAEPAKRSKSIEKAMISRLAFSRNIITIYKYVELEAKRLLDGKELLEQWETFSGLLPCVNTLVYCSLFLKDEGLQRFYALVKDKYPEYKLPEDSEIRLDLVRHHCKTEEVTFEMENTYVMEFCSRNNMEVTRVNEAGHKYSYAAGTVSYSQQM